MSDEVSETPSDSMRSGVRLPDAPAAGANNVSNNKTGDGDDMSVDWIEIADDLLPIKLLRGRSACDCVLDFSAHQDGAEAWDLSDEANVDAAWKAIHKLQPGLVIGSVRMHDSADREKAAEELRNGAKHVEALMDMYE